MQNELVSIIIPTKNSSRTLGDCLESVKNQDYVNIEIIVVDNNSTDNTKEVAGKYTKKVFNIGPERCTQRNYGVRKSTGKYVFIIDSDMKLSPEVVRNCLLKCQKDDVVGVIVPEESFGVGFWAQCKKLERSFYVDIKWMQAARFFKKDVFLTVGGYDEEMVSGEDWDLSQRIERYGKISMIKSLIYHNEGNITLFKTLQKKYYYATKFASYVKKTEHKQNISNQTSVLSRYGLYFKNPKKLFKNPLLGAGMLFMKTAEFAAGALGLIYSKLQKSTD